MGEPGWLNANTQASNQMTQALPALHPLLCSARHQTVSSLQGRCTSWQCLAQPPAAGTWPLLIWMLQVAAPLLQQHNVLRPTSMRVSRWTFAGMLKMKDVQEIKQVRVV